MKDATIALLCSDILVDLHLHQHWKELLDGDVSMRLSSVFVLKLKTLS